MRRPRTRARRELGDKGALAEYKAGALATARRIHGVQPRPGHRNGVPALLHRGIMAGGVDPAGEAAGDHKSAPGNFAGEVASIIQSAAGWIAASHNRNLRLPQHRRITGDEQCGRWGGYAGKQFRVVFATPGQEMVPGRPQPGFVHLQQISVRAPQITYRLAIQARAAQ